MNTEEELTALQHFTNPLDQLHALNTLSNELRDDLRLPIKLTWRFSEKWQVWRADAPAYFDGDLSSAPTLGYYEFWVQPRPGWCDRGRWIAYCENSPGIPSNDYVDMWPRYYFELGAAFEELRIWVNRREWCTKAHRQGITLKTIGGNPDDKPPTTNPPPHEPHL